jgi:hypothetical protein
MRLYQLSIIGLALIATACDRPENPTPGPTTIAFSVALRRVAGTCTVETTPADRTRVQKRNSPTLLWEVKLNECGVDDQIQIRDWVRYPVLSSGLCDTRGSGIRDNPTEPAEQRPRGSTESKARKDANDGCYKYTVYFNDRVLQDPELEIVP